MMIMLLTLYLHFEFLVLLVLINTNLVSDIWLQILRIIISPEQHYNKLIKQTADNLKFVTMHGIILLNNAVEVKLIICKNA